MWGDASVLLGGAPWGVLRIAPAGRAFVTHLAYVGARGAVPEAGVERALTDVLLARGIVHPVPEPTAEVPAGIDVVVPAYQRPELLAARLAALRASAPQVRVIVVDDGSSDDGVARAAQEAGVTLIRHLDNRGPAAARNTGLRESTSDVVVFVDADCAVTPGWLERLIGHFDDPRVAAVAPRVVASSPSTTLLARYQDGQSALDMGPRAELVAHGAPVGYLPSAALAVRRCALSADAAFDEDLRLGEDVDLIWRLIEDGWLIRYEPTALVEHETRTTLKHWARRVFDYGTSAAPLDKRHPGRLAPARFSGWNLAIAALLLARRPTAPIRATAALGVGATAGALLARSLRAASIDPQVAPAVIGRSMKSDAEAAGHLLRREWWPIGWLALLCAWRSRASRTAAVAMIAPLIAQWWSQRPRIDLFRYLGLRLAEDAAYGTGVITSALTGKHLPVLVPRVRLPYLPRRHDPKDRQGRG